MCRLTALTLCGYEAPRVRTCSRVREKREYLPAGGSHSGAGFGLLNLVVGGFEIRLCDPAVTNDVRRVRRGRTLFKTKK